MAGWAVLRGLACHLLKGTTMKRIWIILLLLVIVASSASAAFTWGQSKYKKNVDFALQATSYDPIYNFIGEVEEMFDVEAYGNYGTGSVFYVNSNVTTEGDGTTWTNAKDTLDEAVALCTANNGDIIYVAAGHAEDWSSGDDADLDVAGITVIGLGVGTDRPTFTFDNAAGELVIGADNITIRNLAFLPSVTGVTHAIEIEADADGSVIDGCWFMDGETAATDEFVDAIQPAALADNITVKNCLFESYTAAGANTGIDLTAGVHSDWKIFNNYFNGDYAEAPIYNDNDIDLRIQVIGNVCENTNSGEYGIEFGGAATGVIVGNVVYTDAVATAIDPGSCACFENYAINTTDLSAILVPSLPAIGTVTAGSAEDILKKLYYTSDGTGAYPATVANDSTIAKIMCSGSPATASTFDNTTDSLQAISDKVSTSDAYQPKTVTKVLTTITNGNNNLFTVAGGPVKITELVGYVTTEIEGKSCLINYNFDPTTPATDTAFATDGTALEINADTVGTSYTWGGAIATDLVANAYGVGVAMPSTGIVVPAGSLELAAVVSTSATGEITFYLRYEPLVSGATVTAQ